MLYLLGIAITFFLVFILVTKKNKSTADVMLAFWLAVTGAHLFLYYLLITKKYVAFPFVLGLEIPMPLLHGPFLYLYTAALTNKRHSNKINLLHFIPFAAAVIFLFRFFVLPRCKKLKFTKRRERDMSF